MDSIQFFTNMIKFFLLKSDIHLRLELIVKLIHVWNLLMDLLSSRISCSIYHRFDIRWINHCLKINHRMESIVGLFIVWNL